MKIRDIMSAPARTCLVTDTLDTAARLMWDHDCGAIPVVDGEGRLAGIVTDRDACMAAFTQGRPLRAIPVTVAMAKKVFHAGPDDSVDAVEHLMAEKKIRRVPVIDADKRPIGVVSLNDVARYTVSAGKKGAFEHELSETFAAICEPRRAPMSIGVQA